MDWSTFRTAAGFLATLLRNVTGISLRADRPDAIYNYRLFGGQFHTSGQPTEKQLAAIREAGFRRIINLAPAAVENALPDEAGTLAALDVDYVHIPVDWKDPTDSDFEKFVAAYDLDGDERVWVHCAANMRVSAFIYRYRRDILKEDEAAARAEMNGIWEPFGVWRTFLGWRKE